jgi:hypothetical protein
LGGAEGVRFAYCAGSAGCSSVLTAEHQVDLVRITVKARALGAADVVSTMRTPSTGTPSARFSSSSKIV